MIISARLIARPRVTRRCEVCRKAIEGATLRLYGRAERPDPPYAIYLHPHCVRRPDPKVLRALAPLPLDRVHPELRRHLQEWSQAAA